MKLVPGLRLNFGKRGLSLSAGVRGARVTVGSRGVTRTIGLPGTGLSFTSHRGRTSSRRRLIQPAAQAEPTRPIIDASRFGIVAEPLSPTAGRARPTLLVLAVLLLGVAGIAAEPVGSSALMAAVVLGLMGLVCRSRRSLERVEQARVQDLAYAELARRQHLFAKAFKEVFESAPPLTAAAVRSVLVTQQELGLTDADLLEHQPEFIAGTADFLEFSAACEGRSMPRIAGHEQVLGAGTCYFAEPGVFDKRGDTDPSGTLYLTDEQVVFQATDSLTTTPWQKVVSAERDGRTLLIQRRDRQTAYRFDLRTLGDALKAAFIAQTVMAACSAAGTAGATD